MKYRSECLTGDPCTYINRKCHVGNMQSKEQQQKLITDIGYLFHTKVNMFADVTYISLKFCLNTDSFS